MEVAKQLTSIDQELFAKLTYDELLGFKWTKQGSNDGPCAPP